MLAQASSIITISEGGFSNAAYHLHNDFLVANAAKIIAYHSGNPHSGNPRSGTASTIRKATDLAVDVVNLYERI